MGVERILSKCWNCWRAFRRSESLTKEPLISVTFGKRYTMKVRTSTVFDTSLFSIVKLVRVLSISSFDIYMKLCTLLSEKMSFLSLMNFFSLERLEWLTMLSNRTY